jgi:hypothetical protein
MSTMWWKFSTNVPLSSSGTAMEAMLHLQPQSDWEIKCWASAHMKRRCHGVIGGHKVPLALPP